MCVSTRADVLCAPSIEESAMVFGRGKSRGRGRNFGERDSFGGGCGSYGGRQTIGDKEPWQCKHCGRKNISKKPIFILLLQLLTLVLLTLPLLFYHKRSMIDCVNSSSIKQPFSDSCIIFRYECLYRLSSKALDIRLRSLIPHERLIPHEQVLGMFS